MTQPNPELREQIAERKDSSGKVLKDGCWSCAHYGNHGRNSNGTPPWSVCRFHLNFPECSRWELSEEPWRYDWNWREKLEADATLKLIEQETRT